MESELQLQLWLVLNILNVSISNLPSFVDQLDVKLKTPSFGEIIVSTVFGGDSFVICNSSDFNLKITPDNAKKICSNLKGDSKRS